MMHSHSPARSTDAAPTPAARNHGLASAPAPFSLLRLSALDRLLGASMVVALIWAGVFWALH